MTNAPMRTLVVALVLVTCTQLSCKVNDYCLGCMTVDGGGGDGGSGSGDDGGGIDDGGVCTVSGAEICDGKDNDCDGTIDNGLTAPPICLQGGECGTTTASCVGSAGWTCNYPATVELPETLCDNLDNDCDNRVDEGQPNLNEPCHDGGVGVCKGTGSYLCDTNNLAGPAVCTITMPGQTIPDLVESCDGKDNDCNGTIDEDAIDNFVEIRDASNVLLFKIHAFEASRPDASGASVGTMSHRACSRANVLPWSTVTHTQAAAACAAISPKTRLCTAAEWQQACGGLAALAYPYGNTYEPATCNGKDYDPDCTSPDDDSALSTGTSHGCPTKPATSGCASLFETFDMSGNLKEWTATETSPGAYGIRGGAYDSVAGGLRCDFDFVSATPTFAYANLGFRCCSDP